MRFATRFLVGLLALTLVLGIAGSMVTAQQSKDATGKIASVDVAKKHFVVRDNAGKNWTFHCDAKTKFTLNLRKAKLADLKADDSANVRFEQKGTRNIAMEVRATRAARGR